MVPAIPQTEESSLQSSTGSLLLSVPQPTVVEMIQNVSLDSSVRGRGAIGRILGTSSASFQHPHDWRSDLRAWPYEYPPSDVSQHRALSTYTLGRRYSDDPKMLGGFDNPIIIDGDDIAMADGDLSSS